MKRGFLLVLGLVFMWGVGLGNNGKVLVKDRVFSDPKDLLTYKADTLEFDSCKFTFDSIAIPVNCKRLVLTRCAFQSLKIGSFPNKIDLDISYCNITGSILLTRLRLNRLFCGYNNVGKRLELSEITICKWSKIFVHPRDTIRLNVITCWDSSRLFVDRFFWASSTNIDMTKVTLFLDFVSAIGVVFLDYTSFNLIFNQNEGKLIYPNLIRAAMGENHINQRLNLSLLIRENRHCQRGYSLWGRSISWVVDQWEDYGTGLSNMILFTLSVLLVISLINMAFYRMMARDVYVIPNFTPDVKSTGLEGVFEHFYYSLVYTANIFINPFIKLDNLRYNYNRKLGLLWFAVIYLSGLILFYYIVHYLIEKG